MAFQTVNKGHQETFTATIANTASLSGAVDLGVYRLCGIETPSAIDSATAITFQASADGATWVNIYDATGAEKSITVSTSRRIILTPADFYGVRFIKVRLGTAASPTTATASRDITLLGEA